MSDLKRILIVDDDPDVHHLLRLALQAGEQQIESAYDGLDGLRSIETADYDPVMTDVNMPGLDGMAFSYFRKPFTTSAVAEMVERALYSKPSADDIEVLSARA